MKRRTLFLAGFLSFLLIGACSEETKEPVAEPSEEPHEDEVIEKGNESGSVYPLTGLEQVRRSILGS